MIVKEDLRIKEVNYSNAISFLFCDPSEIDFTST